MSIVISSLRDEGAKAPSGFVEVVVDRSSPLGNPFIMWREARRNYVCDQYELWLRGQLKDTKSPQAIEFRRIKMLVARNTDIALMCWCAPKRCHAESIKYFLERGIR